MCSMPGVWYLILRCTMARRWRRSDRSAAQETRGQEARKKEKKKDEGRRVALSDQPVAFFLSPSVYTIRLCQSSSFFVSAKRRRDEMEGSADEWKRRSAQTREKKVRVFLLEPRSFLSASSTSSIFLSHNHTGLSLRREYSMCDQYPFLLLSFSNLSAFLLLSSRRSLISPIISPPSHFLLFPASAVPIAPWPYVLSRSLSLPLVPCRSIVSFSFVFSTYSSLSRISLFFLLCSTISLSCLLWYSRYFHVNRLSGACDCILLLTFTPTSLLRRHAL